MMLLNLLFAVFLAAHPVHVSVTNLEINRETKEILISQKLFIDDFSLLFYHLFEKNIRFEEGKELSAAELVLVNQYISASFVLLSGKQKLPLEYIRKDQDKEFIWLYYKTSLPSNKIRSLVLTNAILLDLFEDQTNLVIVANGPVEKGYTFNYNNMQSELLP